MSPIHPYDGIEQSENLFCSFTSRNAEPAKVLQPFSSQEMQLRLTKLRDAMRKRQLEVLVLSSPESIYYVSNYQTPGNPLTVLVVPVDSRDELCLFTRELEGSNMAYRGTYPYQTYGEGQPGEQVIAEFVGSLPRRHGRKGEGEGEGADEGADEGETDACNGEGGDWAIGFEASSARLTVKSQRAMEDYLEQFCAERAANGAADAPRKWVDASDIIVSLRNIKSEQEVAYSRKAAAYTLAGIQAAVRAYKPGVTEIEVSGEALRAMSRAGHEYASYPIFLAFGTAGCIAHHAASRRRLSEGELVFIEIGGCCHRYHASKMHTVWIGSQPPSWYLEAEAILKEATAAGRAAARAGAVGRDVDRAMRSVVAQLSFPHWMSARSAYAIGTGLATDWAEKNILIDATADCVLAASMTLHLVPWIQIEGVGSMGFSDTVIVNPDGPATSLFEEEPQRYYESAVRCHSRAPLPAPLPHRAGSPRWAPSPTASPAVVDRAAIAAALSFYDSTRAARPTLRTVEMGRGMPLIHIKDETARMGSRAADVLGVSFVVARMLERGDIPAGGTLAAVADDAFGEALAIVARQRCLGCVLIAPHGVARGRLEVLKGLGASVKQLRGGVRECMKAVEEVCAAHGWTKVYDPRWDAEEDEATPQPPQRRRVLLDLVYGHTQILHEITEDLPEPPTHVFVQAGGGSGQALLAASAAYMAAHYPKTRVVAVENIEGAPLFEAANAETADSAAPPAGLSATLWPLIRSQVCDFLAIGDEWVRTATRQLYHAHGTRVSAHGATAYAGVLAALQHAEGGLREGDLACDLGIDARSRVVVLVADGVVDAESFNDVVGIGAYTTTPAAVVASIRERCGLTPEGAASYAASPIKPGSSHAELLNARGLASLRHIDPKEGAAVGGAPAPASLDASFKKNGAKKGLISRLTALFPSTDSLRSTSSTEELPSMTASADSLPSFGASHESLPSTVVDSDGEESETSGHARSAWTAAVAQHVTKVNTKSKTMVFTVELK